MASQDGSTYRMDPAEMLCDCSVRVVHSGEDEVVVEITHTAADAVGAPRFTAGHVASIRSAPASVPYSPGFDPAHLPAA